MTLTTPSALARTVPIITLRADGTELIIDLRAGYPVIAHWGAPVGPVDPEELDALLDQAVPHSDLDEPVDPGALREAARGFTGRPAIQGHREGRHFSPLLSISDVDHDEASVAITLTDASAGLTLELRYRMLPSGVVLIDTEVSNTGASAYTLNELAAWLPLPDRASTIVDFTGRWLRERQLVRRPIAAGLTMREGREGRSGHDYTIVHCATTLDAGVGQGEVWAMSLLWSGNTRHMLERLPTGRSAIGAGELLEPGEIILQEDESYAAPTVAAIYSSEGLDGLSDRSHRWLRSRPEHPSRPRPLTLNVWEAVYFDHDIDRLRSLADVAARVGVERFVLDDGWFGSRRDDHSGLGDWTVSEEVWPDGLAPLADHVRSLGMEFGLWFEGEMVNPDSDLYRAHPDWILHVDGRVPPTARNQLVLDLTHADAFAHVLEQVHAVIREAGVSYIKWDHNRALVDPAHAGRPATHRQTLAIYALFDELKRRNPGLEIESCASGGGRIDLGMAMHADRFWTSDSNDALERQENQRWTGLVIPPELLGTHIGPTISHSSGRRASIQFRAITALFGHAGIEWNLLEASEEELEAITRWARLYRSERGLLHSGRVVRVQSSDEAVQVSGVVAHDRSRALFGIAQLRTSGGSRPDAILITGLDPEAHYRVSSPDLGGAGTVQHRPPRWMAGATLSGAMLATIGLRPPILHPEQAVLLRCERVDA